MADPRDRRTAGAFQRRGNQSRWYEDPSENPNGQVPVDEFARVDSQVTHLWGDFTDLRRENREEHREMRAAIESVKEDLNDKIDRLEEKVDGKLGKLDEKIDGVAEMVKPIASDLRRFGKVVVGVLVVVLAAVILSRLGLK